ncbi:DmpA family aminopeptidase [Saccharothrix hoggarensis]|uniref:P1 family peptidase n=1 Tax=Saccharothrix hoggarensis TaxID=913853 RepID=A0ABW3QP65_9PSEU
MRARDLGISVGVGEPGPFNAITDVPGVKVGHRTLISGDGRLRQGFGPVRTGVTVVVPADGSLGRRPVFAGCHRLNGNGELTGLEWVRESGTLTSPIGLTNTHSVGVVRDALVAAEVATRGPDELYWCLPVVGETWDGLLNDINGFHVRPEHLHDALADATGGPVAEGAVGSGTGMVCHGFKGGIGTASRMVDGHAVGVLVQANHGRRERFTVNGVPVGRLIGAQEVPLPAPPGPAVPVPGAGSIIVVVATDAPLLPHQCDRLAQRAAFGIARTGGTGEPTSGDLVIAFSVANRVEAGGLGVDVPREQRVTMLSDNHIGPLFDAVVESVEEAILNALVSARTTVGRDGVVAHALPHTMLLAALDR